MPLTSAFAAAIGDVQGRRDDDVYRRQSAFRYEQDRRLRVDDLAFRRDQASEQRRIREDDRLKGSLGTLWENTPEGRAGALEWEGDVTAARRAPTALPPPTMTERATEARSIFDETGLRTGGFTGYPEEEATPVLQNFASGGQRYTFNPRGGAVERLVGPGGEHMKDERSVAPTEQERRAAMVYPRSQMGMDEVLKLVDQFGGPPGLSQMFGTGLGRFAQGEEVQRFNAAAQAVVSGILRVESGAAISVAETEQMFRIMIPQPGDEPETAAMKLEVLQAQVEAMKNAASLVQPDIGQEPEPGSGAPMENPYGPRGSGAAISYDAVRDYQNRLR